MKKLLVFILLLSTTACHLQGKSLQEIFTLGAQKVNTPAQAQNTYVDNQALKIQDSVVVCRDKQCAPASISMSREYIHNSLLQIFSNNNKSTALICNASENTHTCLQNYITVPIKVGITPANMYIDSVKISDLTMGPKNQSLDLLLNYNVTFNGQSPDCTTAKTMIYAKSTNHIILEDAGYQCKMTAIGKTTVKTVFAIDYIDLDYGFIGGYYSIGLSGPAYGGGVGYMLIRLMKDAYPLTPALQIPEQKNQQNQQTNTQQTNTRTQNKVEVFPINKK